MSNSKRQSALFRTYLVLFSIILISMTSIGCKSSRNDISGTIRISGSSTMSNLISLWCKGFSDIYHNTNCMVASFGSDTAPQDLEKGSFDLGAMSEPMSNADKQSFKNIYGHEPVEIKVAHDMIAVLVNRENPVNCITTDQLDGIYSSTNSCQGSTKVTIWGDLSLEGEWATTPINVYGRTPSSGTYDVFQKIALCNGTYKKSITELASPRDIVDFVSRDTSSIGYSGAGLLAPGVKTVAIGESKDNCYLPEPKHATSKQYPLTRDFYLYLKEDPEAMKKTTREFLKYVLSKSGQQAVMEAGLITLPPSIINEQRSKITD